MTTPNDEQARRDYWSSRLDEADAFMQQILEYPVEECGEPMAPLAAAVAAAGVEVAFSERPHARGRSRCYFLRRGLIPQLLSAAAELNTRGWVLKVEDAYRTVAMQRDLGLQENVFATVLSKVRWECGRERPPTELLYRRLGALVATSPRVGTHMSGSALDISVLRRDSGEEVDRGAPYLELSELTPMTSPFVSAAALENRDEITDLMGRHGFVTYPWEFWHYNAGDAYEGVLNRTGRPARYGPVHLDLADGGVTPIDDPTAPADIGRGRFGSWWSGRWARGRGAAGGPGVSARRRSLPAACRSGPQTAICASTTDRRGTATPASRLSPSLSARGGRDVLQIALWRTTAANNRGAPSEDRRRAPCVLCH